VVIAGVEPGRAEVRDEGRAVERVGLDHRPRQEPERVEDGLYCARAVERLRELVESPEKLG
jgi:hypothetical protein